MKNNYKTFKEFGIADPSPNPYTDEEILEYGWSEAEVEIATNLYHKILEDIETKGDIDLESPELLAEGLLSSVVGAAAGLTIGPAIGKAIAKALGAEKGGALYRMLTSRLVLGALGAAIFKGK